MYIYTTSLNNNEFIVLLTSFLTMLKCENNEIKLLIYKLLVKANIFLTWDANAIHLFSVKLLKTFNLKDYLLFNIYFIRHFRL